MQDQNLRLFTDDKLIAKLCHMVIHYQWYTSTDHRKNSIQIRANGISVEFCRREEVRQLNGMVVGRTRMCPALKPLLIEYVA